MLPGAFPLADVPPIRPRDRHRPVPRAVALAALWLAAAVPASAQSLARSGAVAAFAPSGAVSAQASCAVVRCQSDADASLGAGGVGDGHAVAARSEPLSPRVGPVIERGVASWYGAGFHGRTTASGEKFDMDGFTAAHKTLPFGTRVLVSNPRTGKEVVVRINDRGPHVRNRIIDLSTAAARALGLKGRGLGVVVLREALPPDNLVASAGQ